MHKLQFIVIMRTRLSIFFLALFFFASGTSLHVYAQDDLQKSVQRLWNSKNPTVVLQELREWRSKYPQSDSALYYLAAYRVKVQYKLPEALRLLGSVDQDKMPVEIYFYLGKAYFLLYQFDEALDAFSKFKQQGSASVQKQLRVQQYIDYCLNNLSSTKNYWKGLKLIESKKFALFEAGGLIPSFGQQFKLVQIEEAFKSRLDKKLMNPYNLLQSSYSKDHYYAGYGKKGSTGTDLYYRTRENRKKSISKAENLGPEINSYLNEINPLILNNNEIYFCSNGPGSLGGYDIFRSEYDPETQQWSKPHNIGFPLNTPYDDFLFVPENDDEIILYSNRNCRIDSFFLFRLDKKNALLESIDTDLPELLSLSLFKKADVKNAKKESKLSSLFYSEISRESIHSKEEICKQVKFESDSIASLLREMKEVNDVLRQIVLYKRKASLKTKEEIKTLRENLLYLKSDADKLKLKESQQRLKKILDEQETGASYGEMYQNIFIKRIENLEKVNDFYQQLVLDMESLGENDVLDYLNKAHAKIKPDPALLHLPDDDKLFLQSKITNLKDQIQLNETALRENRRDREQAKANIARGAKEQSTLSRLESESQVLLARNNAFKTELAEKELSLKNLLVLLDEIQQLMPKDAEEPESPKKGEPAEIKETPVNIVEDPVYYRYFYTPANLSEEQIQALYKSTDTGSEYRKIQKKEKKIEALKNRWIDSKKKLAASEAEFQSLPEGKKKERAGKKFSKQSTVNSEAEYKYLISLYSYKRSKAKLWAGLLSNSFIQEDSPVSIHFDRMKQQAFRSLQELANAKVDEGIVQEKILKLTLADSLLNHILQKEYLALGLKSGICELDSIAVLFPMSLKKNELSKYAIRIASVRSLDANLIPDFFKEVVYEKQDSLYYLFDCPGFESTDQAQKRLEKVKEYFVDGFLVSMDGKAVPEKHVEKTQTVVVKEFTAPEPEKGFYSIQLGAFRNKPDLQRFAELEKDIFKRPANTFEIYYFGKYNSKERAQSDLSFVRSKGFKDAFVKQFGQEKTKDFVEKIPAEQKAKEPIPENNRGESCYSVQLGVFSTTPNIPAIVDGHQVFSFDLKNGLKKYTCACFNSKSEASNLAKSLTKRFPGAFPVLINRSEAKGLNPKSGNDNLQQENNPPAAKKTNKQNDAIEFRIQLAAYSTMPSADLISNFIQSSGSYEVNHFTDENGTILITAGHFTTYDEAKNARIELLKSGLKDIFIIGFKGNTKIPVSEAIRLSTNN